MRSILSIAFVIIVPINTVHTISDWWWKGPAFFAAGFATHYLYRSIWIPPVNVLQMSHTANEKPSYLYQPLKGNYCWYGDSCTISFPNISNRAPAITINKTSEGPTMIMRPQSFPTDAKVYAEMDLYHAIRRVISKDKDARLMPVIYNGGYVVSRRVVSALSTRKSTTRSDLKENSPAQAP